MRWRKGLFRLWAVSTLIVSSLSIVEYKNSKKYEQIFRSIGATTYDQGMKSAAEEAKKYTDDYKSKYPQSSFYRLTKTPWSDSEGEKIRAQKEDELTAAWFQSDERKFATRYFDEANIQRIRCSFI